MKKVLVDADQSVVTLTLNDPATLNAFGVDMTNEIRDAVRFVADPANGFRCLVITGAGRGFCSGGNLGWIDESRADKNAGGNPGHGITLGTHHHYVLKQLKDLKMPVITAVNGAAAGIGFSYALAGDMIIASKSAFFVASFSNIGVSCDGGLSWTLPRLIGWARAKELLLMGNRLTATTALDWGLINRVYDDETFREQTAKLAHELANGPTVALGELRNLAWQSWTNSFEQQLDMEEHTQPGTFATEDASEGIKAMLSKREPGFKGM